MPTNDERKNQVRDAYTQAATPAQIGNCCGPKVASLPLNNPALMADDYTHLTGYVPGADLGLGCGLPTQFAQIKPGDVVVDLGSGAGNDCFVARAETGETGRVIGLDMTPAMIDRARQTADRLGYNNVEFMEGDIEAMPLASAMADVVVSNCVMNLVPDKQTAFDEIYRILKPGGRFCISDVVVVGTLPDRIREAAELYVGCVSGAIHEPLYLDIIAMAGFEKTALPKRKAIHLPDDLLTTYLTDSELATFRASGAGLFSLTIYAEKLAGDMLNLSAADLAMPLAISQTDNPDDDDLAQFDFLGRL